MRIQPRSAPGDWMFMAPEISQPLTLPVDYLLLLGSNDPADVRRAVDEGLVLFHPFFVEKPDEHVLELLLNEPVEFARDAAAGEWLLRDARKLPRQAARWRRSGIPALFLRAARRAVQGRFTPQIGEHLARVRFGAGIKEDEVGDFLALAAWCLDQVLRTGARGTGKYQVRKCKLCKQPFLATAGANYCHRTAPGDRSRAADSRYLGTPRDHFRLFPTCLGAGSVKDYRARKRAWRLVTGTRSRTRHFPGQGRRRCAP